MSRILHIVEPFATGVLSFLLDLTREQVKSHDVYVIYGKRIETPKNIAQLVPPEVHLILMEEFTQGAIRSLLNIGGYLKLRKLYDDIAPDVVHLHSSVAGFIGRWVLPCSKVNVVYTPHGFSFLMQGMGGLKKKLFYSIEKISACRKCRIIGCSEGEQKEALKLRKDSLYVNNGIQCDAIMATGDDEPLNVYTSGRILPQKNPVLYNSIARECSDVNFKWIGCGDLDVELTSSNISVTGWLGRQESVAATEGYHIFVLTSLYEGLPISLLEAMCMRKVCVVSNVIGNKNVINDGVNGFLCNTKEDFVRVIKGIREGKYDLKTIADNARRDVLENYNGNSMAKKYDEIYFKK